MPVPRKSTLALNKTKATRKRTAKKKAPTAADTAVRGEVVAVRIEGQKVYGKCQEMYEAAPFMFAPVEMRGQDHA